MSCKEFPTFRGEMEYVCISCGRRFEADNLYYTCPECGSVLLLEDRNFDKLKEKPGQYWRDLFDSRQMTRCPALKGVFRFYELIAPIVDENDIVYLGEANTPQIEAARHFREELGISFAFKNDGQNPSASFKDRGMACAFSYLKYLCGKYDWKEVLAICASTGDTSAAAALYASYVGSPLKCVVLLPRGRVTPQQLAQPLGSGAVVIELPGVFDDCMKVVENLAEHYRVCLLNSKNSWRILGQESYAYEIAQCRSWNMEKLALFVPVGNAGNITAIMSGCLKMLELGMIDTLPRIFGVQSEHADPVYQYFRQAKGDRHWQPVQVQPSVAQAAMIGNPVSFPRVNMLAEKYLKIAGDQAFQVVQVKEQEIMDSMMQANRNGHIACTQGGECLAGMKKALATGLLSADEYAVLDSTAHMLKFIGFQEKYFEDSFEPAYGIKARDELKNNPVEILSDSLRETLNLEDFTRTAAEAVANYLELEPLPEKDRVLPPR